MLLDILRLFCLKIKSKYILLTILKMSIIRQFKGEWSAWSISNKMAELHKLGIYVCNLVYFWPQTMYIEFATYIYGAYCRILKQGRKKLYRQILMIISFPCLPWCTFFFFLLMTVFFFFFFFFFFSDWEIHRNLILIDFYQLIKFTWQYENLDWTNIFNTKVWSGK